MVNAARRRMAMALFVLVVGLLGGGATAAIAVDDYPGRTPPSIPPTSAVAAKVLGRTETRIQASDPAAGDPIPITGGDVAGLAAMGAGAVAVGMVLLRRGRRAPA